MLNKFTTYSICRLSVAFVWLYHGIVPKLLGPHVDELAMNRSLGMSYESAMQLAMIAGVAEVIFGFIVLVFWHQRWPLVITILAMIGLLAFTVVLVPNLLAGAFNPVTTNLTVLALAVIALKQPEVSKPCN